MGRCRTHFNITCPRYPRTSEKELPLWLLSVTAKSPTLDRVASGRRCRPTTSNTCQNVEFVNLPLGLMMSGSGDHERFLHFNTTGIVSLIYDLEDGYSSEIALVGNQEMVGISIFMGGESMPSYMVAQSAGTAFRLSRKIAKQEFSKGGKMQHLSLLFTQALMTQTSQTAVCNQHHSLEQQLCRWLLMSVDRLHTNKLVITQELIGNLLGVRRETVTGAASKMRVDGLVTYARGRITVVGRAGLEDRVCECYATVKGEYDRLLPHSHGTD